MYAFKIFHRDDSIESLNLADVEPPERFHKNLARIIFKIFEFDILNPILFISDSSSYNSISWSTQFIL